MLASPKAGLRDTEDTSCPQTLRDFPRREMSNEKILTNFHFLTCMPPKPIESRASALDNPFWIHAFVVGNGVFMVTDAL
jgi:hypothetical protein